MKRRATMTVKPNGLRWNSSVGSIVMALSEHQCPSSEGGAFGLVEDPV